MTRTVLATVVASLVLATGAAGAAPLPKPYEPKIDPAEFSTTIDNPFLPFAPGERWVYTAKTPDGTERTVVHVTDKVRNVAGVDTVVVRDTVTLDGQPLEDTFDWYAQDRAGNVWYFGEDTKEYEHGKVVSTKGSWEAGVDGARPGIVMEADPRPGDSYRQEYDPGNAEDAARVLRTGATARVRNHAYRDALVTRDTTRLEPQLVEHKYFVAGIGLVLEDTVRGGPERVELVSHTPA